MEGIDAWKRFKGRQTPSSVELDEIFYNTVPEGSHVLDFGCAWGRIAFQLQDNGYKVTGFDMNENAIREADKLALKTNGKHRFKVKFETADATNLHYRDETFDSCIIQAFMTTITEPEERIRVIEEANRVLKKNGTLYLADFGQNWENNRYKDMYERYYPETGEMGTFIVTDTGAEDGKQMFLAHHYTRNELLKLVEEKFRVKTFKETVFTTFHGNRTTGYIIIARKK